MATINATLASKGLMLKTGTVVDASVEGNIDAGACPIIIKQGGTSLAR